MEVALTSPGLLASFIVAPFFAFPALPREGEPKTGVTACQLPKLESRDPREPFDLRGGIEENLRLCLAIQT